MRRNPREWLAFRGVVCKADFDIAVMRPATNPWVSAPIRPDLAAATGRHIRV